MTEKKLSRRDALKILGTAVGAAALATLPSKWSKPELLSGVLPAHARQSVVSPCIVTPGSRSFTTPGTFTFVVPACVTSLNVDAYGAAGGNEGGRGGRVVLTITVTPGETLTVSVGGRGADGDAGGAGGSNGGGAGNNYGGGGGGGGGGWSGLRGVALLAVAGGGGGGGSSPAFPDGGAGGGTKGGSGEEGVPFGFSGGGGGTQLAGGTRGDASIDDEPGKEGTAGAGGDGGYYHGGGGGGGYFGGGGGGGDMVSGGGGGGGSSYTIPGATGVAHTQGVQSGDGQVILSWP